MRSWPTRCRSLWCQCRALDVASQHGTPIELVERTEWGATFDRAAYTDRLVKVLLSHGVDLVVMAGFGTVVPGIADAFPGRVLNSHPALLPAFKGWHAVRDALAHGRRAQAFQTLAHAVGIRAGKGVRQRRHGRSHSLCG